MVGPRVPPGGAGRYGRGHSSREEGCLLGWPVPAAFHGPSPWGGDELRGHAECGMWSRAAEGQPAPQPPTQAVLDPALLPLFHSRGLVGGPEHGDTAAPTGRGGSAAGGPGRGPSTAPHCPPEASLWRHRAGQVCPAPGPGCRNGWLSLPLPRMPRCGNPGLAEPPLSHTPEAHLVHALHSSVG